MRPEILFFICSIILSVTLVLHILCRKAFGIIFSWLGLVATTLTFLLLFYWLNAHVDAFVAFFFLCAFIPLQILVALIAFAFASKKEIILNRLSLLWIISGLGFMVIFVFNSISLTGL